MLRPSLLFSGLLTVVLTTAALNGGELGHLGESRCATCHLATGEITPSNSSSLIASQEQLCGTCHADAMRVSHPSGRHVKGQLPEPFRVDWKGDLTCSSCHLVHGEGNKLLRVAERGKGYCLRCHDEAFFAQMRDGGQAVIRGSHVAETIYRGDVTLDSYSVNCMECHIGKEGIGRVAITGSILRHGSGSANHPIGINYDSAARFGGYRNRRGLSENILLPAGLLSCLSCHEGYSERHGRLVLPKQQLCYECHDL